MKQCLLASHTIYEDCGEGDQLASSELVADLTETTKEGIVEIGWTCSSANNHRHYLRFKLADLVALVMAAE